MTRLLRTCLAALLLALLGLALALEITFLDVGQGVSVLIEADSGQTVLYDAGPASGDATAQLQGLGVTSLSLVIASHAHADHIGGMADAIYAFTPSFYLDNGVPYTTRTYERTLLAVQAVGAQLLEPTRRTITLGDVRLTILPPPGLSSFGQNDNSVGVRIEYGSFTALLPGDAEAREWAWWLANHSDLLEGVDVLLASHHGSRNGDTAAGLAKTNPDLVVISAGAGNVFGHPHPEALALYRSATVLRTDTHGRITVQVAGDGSYTVSAQRPGVTPTLPPVPAPPAPAPRPPSHTAPPAPSPVTGCVDINRAGSVELQRIIHIGPSRAADLIRLRPFRSVNDLRRISGIGNARLADIRTQGLACVR